MFSLSKLALACAIGLGPASAMAQDAVSGDPLASARPMPDAELAQARGGFEIAGLIISLGADLRTYLNGELALRTLFTWGDGGVETQQFVSAALTQATADQLRAGMFSEGGIRLQLGDQQVFFANQGQTALIHNVEGGIQNMLLNTANNTAVRQEVDLTLNLSGYDTFRDSISAGTLPQGMAGELDAALGAAAGN
ncbi:hypothetical protein [Sphingomonas naasensis]|nr:hypothetical protein [Sphingomonas naasensis]